MTDQPTLTDGVVTLRPFRDDDVQEVIEQVLVRINGDILTTTIKDASGAKTLTNITVPTVSNLTNAPTNGDFTNTITSIS